jgi:hypothetical protein
MASSRSSIDVQQPEAASQQVAAVPVQQEHKEERASPAEQKEEVSPKRESFKEEDVFEEVPWDEEKQDFVDSRSAGTIARPPIAVVDSKRSKPFAVKGIFNRKAERKGAKEQEL